MEYIIHCLVAGVLVLSAAMAVIMVAVVVDAWVSYYKYGDHGEL